MARHGEPEIFNTDQGSQFTSAEFTSVLLVAGISISMDGTGIWRDNVFIDRIWRPIKYKEVYLEIYKNAREVRSSLSKYINFCNSGRPDSSLDGRTPDEAYFGERQMAEAA